MFNPEEFIAKISAVDPGKYDMSIPELFAIRDSHGSDHPLELIALAFQYGFLRGQRAEKNRRRKTA